MTTRSSSSGIHRLLSGISWNYAQMLVGFLALVITTPFILTRLGGPAFGVWVVLGSLQGYLLLADFGFNTAVARYTSRAIALRETVRLNALLSSVFALILTTGFAIVAVGISAAHFIPDVFQLSETISPDAIRATYILSVQILVMLVGGLSGNVLNGCQRFDLWKMFGTVQIVLNAGLSMSFVAFGWGLVGLATAGLVASVAMTILCWTAARQVQPSLRIDLTLASLPACREVFAYSSRAFILSFTSRILYYTDCLVIATFLGAAAVVPYEVAFKLCFMTTYLFSSVSSTMFAKFSNLQALGAVDQLRLSYLRLVKVTMLIAAPVQLFLLLGARPMIDAWVGHENVAAGSLIEVLILMNIFHAIGTPAAAFLQATGLNRALMWAELANAACNIAISVLLVTRAGAIGVASATVLSHFLTSFWIVLILPCRVLGISVGRYLADTLLPPLIIAAPFAVLAAMITHAVTRITLVNLLIWFPVILGGYATAYVMLAANSDERRALKSLALFCQIRN